MTDADDDCGAGDLMKGFAEELVEESIGVSYKRWALMLLSLAAGAVIALWLRGRISGAVPESVATDAAPGSHNGAVPDASSAAAPPARFSREAIASKLRRRGSEEPATAID
jgi:hypothetical protein